MVHKIVGTALIIVASALIFSGVYQATQFPFSSIPASGTPNCVPGPYPNPGLPAGASLTTNGNQIGYYQGSSFIPYTGTIAGLVITSGIASACNPPMGVTTTGTPFSTTTQSATVTVTPSISTTVIGSSTSSSVLLMGCSSNCTPFNWLIAGGVVLLGLGALIIVRPKTIGERA